VPKYLSQQWSKASGRGEVGKLRISKNQGRTEVSFTLNEELASINDIGGKPASVSAPREHPFLLQSVGGQTLTVFTESSAEGQSDEKSESGSAALAARAAPVEPHLPGATAFPGKQPWILKPVVVSLLFGLHLQKLLQRGGATLPKEDAAASFGVKSGGSGSILEKHKDLGFQVTEIMLGVELWESPFNVQTDCGLHECSIHLLDSPKL
ncbi:General transcription factor IIF subunit 2, partial [Anas platyrhynchos]